MTKKILCEIVYKICEACGFEFILMFDDTAATNISNESADVLRRAFVLYSKDVNGECS